MALYRYVKKKEKKKLLLADFMKGRKERKKVLKKESEVRVEKKNVILNIKAKSLKSAKMPKWAAGVVPVAFILIGVSFMVFAGMPIFSWTVSYDKKAPEDKIIKPISGKVGGEVLSDEDMSDPDDWFIGAEAGKGQSEVSEYKMTIPKFGIEEANVIVGGDDLTKSLIQYGKTAVPGNLGTAVVFGHSVLPQFFNPKDYHSIFAKLPEIEEGDEIFVDVDGVKYKYVVYGMETVDPDDLSVLEQHYDNYYLYVVTCVPPGLDLKRLVVKCKLEEI